MTIEAVNKNNVDFGTLVLMNRSQAIIENFQALFGDGRRLWSGLAMRIGTALRGTLKCRLFVLTMARKWLFITF
jgi:hypothetical protein